MQKIPECLIGNKKTSVIGFGCWQIGGRDWGTQNDTDSINALKKAFDLGINHYDTAQAYGKGHAEDLLGKVFQSKRDNVFIASKMMYTIPSKVEQLLQLSLKRLKTDYIDLFYIHWPKQNIEMAPIMEELVKARAKGMIRSIGVSNFNVPQMIEVMRGGSIDVHQIAYNLLWRWPEKDVIPFCIEKGIQIVTYSSMAEGILAGKFSRELHFGDGDHRKDGVLFDPDVWPFVYDCVENMKLSAKKAECPLMRIAIQWLLKQKGVSVALTGIRNAEQAMGVADIFQKVVDDSVIAEITKLSDLVQQYIPDTGNIFRWYP
jgi:aryl-alcohol dehydrogenase-like predicted oxidoreductase